MSHEAKTFTRDQVLEEATKYFGGNSFAAKIWTDKYALRDDQDRFKEKNPRETFVRIAKEFARIEKKFPNPMSEEEILELIDGFRFIVPQGSPLFGIGNPYQLVSLSNCFVIEVVDSYGGILRADERIAQICKRRGGVGLDISPIRPQGLSTKNAARTTDGIVVFMERFSRTCREVAQSGRRGALMLTCSVHHPEIMSFIKSKADLKRVTGANISVRVTNEFMQAVKSNGKYEVRWPVDSKNPVVSQKIEAKQIWNELIKHAHAYAEPGILFWDNVIENSPADCYSAEGFKTSSTNPCLVGDTMVYVADGRGTVSLKQLATEGKDVPVFCFDNNRNVCVRTMRHPRLTGKKAQIYKIFLDDGSFIRCTGNHKFLLKNGTYREAKHLESGDSLSIVTRYIAPMPEKGKKQPYYWLANGWNNTKAEHRFIAEGMMKRRLRKDEIVHHRNYNGLDNSDQNIEVMSAKKHAQLHRIDKIGSKNPMSRAKEEWSENQWENYKKNMSIAVSGTNNGRCLDVKNEDIVSHAIALTKSLGRQFFKREWQDYAKEHGLPVEFSEYRRKELGSLKDLSRTGTEKCHLPVYKHRQARLIQEAQNQGYDVGIINGEVSVKRTCENCNSIFWVPYSRRETGFCSSACSRTCLEKDPSFVQKRKDAIYNHFSEQMSEVKDSQINIYNDLRVKLNRHPKLNEWESACSKNGVSKRLKTKFGFKDFEDVKNHASLSNHRVVSVVLDTQEDVYNGTVDEFHNFFVGAFESTTRSGETKWAFVNTLNCGELPSSPEDSCRLTVDNLAMYVVNPFTDKAEFDWKLFATNVRKTQRIMDDLVELEIESVERIIKKVQSDPEDEDVKANELSLWKGIRKRCSEGRRTGHGITSLGDAIAMLGMKYGDPNSIKFVKRVYETLRDESYASSIQLAKERKPFPAFDHNKEKDHPFLKRLPQDLQKDMAKHGRRNIALLTTPPAGSISNIIRLLPEAPVFGVTSGFEPVYLAKYDRKVKMSSEDKSAPDHIDALGDRWKIFEIQHPGLMTFSKITGKKFEESPYYGSQSGDLDFSKRVEMQAVATSFVDHAISSTVNLPADATEEIVADLYIKAWEKGCKGLTVYRQGSREGVLSASGSRSKKDCDECDEVAETFSKLVMSGKRPTKIIASAAPKRPPILDCDIVRTKVGGGDWIFIIGKLHGRPYEVFGGESKDISIPKKYKTGWTVKDGKEGDRSLYDLFLGDLENEDERMTIRNIAKTFKNYQHAPFTRLVSTSLRHGVPINWICEQITKDPEDDLFTYNKALARVLKKYIQDGDKSGTECSECHNEMVYKNGCPTCMVCGMSSCS